MSKSRTILKTMRSRREENSHGRGAPSEAPVRERFAPDSPEYKGARIEIRCSEKTKALAVRMAKRRGVSLSELFRYLVEGA